MEPSQSTLTDLALYAASALRLGLADTDLITGNSVWNDEMYYIFGITKGAGEQIKSGDWLKYIDPEYRDYIVARREASITTGAQFHEIFSIQQPSGVRRTVEFRSQVLRNEHGIIVRVQHAVQDITDQIETQSAHRLATRLMGVLNRAVMSLLTCKTEEDLYDGICTALTSDPAFPLSFVALKDDNAEKNLNIVAAKGRAEAYSRKLKITWDDSPTGNGPTGRAIRTGQAQINRSFESNQQVEPWRDLARQNNIKASIAAPIALGDQVIGAFTIYSSEAHTFGQLDIEFVTELARAISIGLSRLRSEVELSQTKTELADADRRFANVSAAVPGLVYQWREGADGSRGYTWVGSRAAEMYGISNEELLADWRLVNIHPDDQVEWQNSIEQSKARKSVWNFTGRFIPPDQRIRWVNCVAMPELQTDSSTLFTGVAIDVTQQIERQEALAKLRTDEARAEATSKAKSEFIAILNHELRTPLSAILNYATLVKEELADGNYVQAVSDLESIFTSANYLTTLINDVLDFSKIEAGKLEIKVSAIQFDQFISELESIARPLVEKNANALKVSCIGCDQKVCIDQLRVKQCLINLIGNAAKFTHNGRIVFSAEIKTSTIELRVSDNGIGMSESQLERIFIAYAQGDSDIQQIYGGTGLGLSLTKQLVSAMGGQISVTSAPNAGSEFTIVLPFISEANT